MSYVLRNAYVTLDTVNVSSMIESVEVQMTAADVNTTAMGAGGQQHLAGIRDDRFVFNAFSSFGLNSLDAIISPKFLAAGTLAVVVYANGAVIGTSNPSFSGFCPLLTYTPVGGRVGDAAMTPLELPVAGTITVATA